MRRIVTCSVSFLAVILVPLAAAWAQPVVPANFQQTNYKTGMSSITGMAWAKDGTDDLLFVTQKSGELRVIKNGALQSGNVAFVTVTTASECGLDNVIIDPNYASNKNIFVFASVNGSTQRVLRFTISNGATVGISAGPTQIGPDLPTMNANHDGGGMAIGADGYLYVGIGNNGNGNHVGSDGYPDEWTSYGSKILRIDRSTGMGLTGNPFYDGNTNSVKSRIFAKGFRNPFGLRCRPGTSDLWLSEVGDGWEQIFLVTAGSTQGWPTENNTTDTSKLMPKLAYQTNVSSYGGCITRGAFYTGSMFPSTYMGNFFFVDYNSGHVMRAIMNSGNNGFTSSAIFVNANGSNSSLTDINTGPDGALYYSNHGGTIYRLAYTGTTAQSIVTSTTSLTVNEGTSGTFQVHLAVAPSGNVTVTAARSSGSTDITVSGGATLTFTTANWMTNQTVTIAAAEDTDTTTDTATITLSATGVTSVNVAITAPDNDTAVGAPVVTLTQPTNGSTVSGTNAEFYGSATTGGTLDRGEFYVDGVLKYTDPYVAATGHFHYNSDHVSWNTTAIPNGTHTVMLKVFDTSGLSGSASATVTVNNSAGSKGLQGDYYSGTNFDTYVFSRVDPGVNFNWGTGRPDTSLPMDGFSVRWTGEVTPAFTETYTFYVRSDDGSRLWVNGVKLFDKWVDQGPTEWSGTINLKKDVPADIIFEYYENTGGAAAQLSWSSPSTTKGTIPSGVMANTVLTGGPAGGGGKGGGGGGGGGGACGLTGFEGVILLGLAAASRRRKR